MGTSEKGGRDTYKPNPLEWVPVMNMVWLAIILAIIASSWFLLLLVIPVIVTARKLRRTRWKNE